MLKMLFTCAATLALSAATLPSAFAATAASPETNIAQAQSVIPEKTSDRTPGNPAPHRTPGSNIWGAAGVDRAITVFGTSDRTPENHYHPATH